MPYVKKRAPNKKRPAKRIKAIAKRKKPFRYEVADMAATAYEGVMRLKRLVNVETKKHDFNFSSSAITTTGNITNLSLVPQGDGYQNRDGNSIKPQYLTGRVYVSNDPSYVDSSVVRLILFRAINENGVTPTVADLLESADPMALRNYTEKSRFTILSDQTYVISPLQTGRVLYRYIQYSVALDKHVHFVSGSTSSENGGLYMLQISNRGTLYPVLTGNMRMTFTDN